MPYETDEKLKSYLDTNQLHREQMCRAILAIDKRFSDVHPRHPHGGPDGGRDIQAIFKSNQLSYAAIGFVNQANDSKEQKRTIRTKFDNDLNSALKEDIKPSVFIFFTNINLTTGEKETLINKAKDLGIIYCDIFDRERMRIELDNPDGFSIRFQYLNISLSEEEQASFFARWGDDIQTVISTGFQQIKTSLDRIIFLQESRDPLFYLTFIFQLKKSYLAEEISHFRLFCSAFLKRPVQHLLSILFGSSDKSNRIWKDKNDLSDQIPGIKYGISGGQWEMDLEENDKDMGDDPKTFNYKCVGSSKSIGRDEIEFFTINYSKDTVITDSTFSFKDLDEASFLPLVNKSLAEKLKAIHIYANGYKIKEIKSTDFYVDDTDFDPQIPVDFSEEELEDKWVRVRPNYASAFSFDFFSETPIRDFIPAQIVDSLKKQEKK